jgi:hypothetical protein
MGGPIVFTQRIDEVAGDSTRLGFVSEGSYSSDGGERNYADERRPKSWTF